MSVAVSDGAAAYPCTSCGGEATLTRCPYAVEREGRLVVIRDVPTYECDECGDTFFATEVMKQLDALLGELFAGRAEQSIVRFPVAA